MISRALSARVVLTSPPRGDHTIDVGRSHGSSGARLDGHKGGVFSTTFSADGKRLASAGYDNTAKVWEVANGREILLFEANKTVYCAAFSPDGCAWLRGHRQNHQGLGPGDRPGTLTLLGHAERIFSLTFSPDGNRSSRQATILR